MYRTRFASLLENGQGASSPADGQNSHNVKHSSRSYRISACTNPLTKILAVAHILRHAKRHIHARVPQTVASGIILVLGPRTTVVFAPVPAAQAQNIVR